MDTTLPRVVIVGGGFAGLAAAKQLKKARAEVTLIDRSNHHLFQPLLYQVATAGLGAPEIAEPIRYILRKQDNTRVILGEVKSIDCEERFVCLDGRKVPFDYLVLATGATHSYFGNEGWEEHAPGLKTLEDAFSIRERVLMAYERAERAECEEDRQRELTFVVVGGGPTGVEMAGALVEIAEHTMARNFRNFDPSDARVILVEAMDRVLGAYDPQLSERGLEQLRDLGVDVRLKTMVTDIREDGVELNHDTFLAASTVVWGAGVQASPLGAFLPGERDRAGRVKVDENLNVPGRGDIFVLGDLSAVEQPDGSFVPGLAPAAQQMGRYTGRRIRRLLAGKSVEPFSYRDKGQMATIGRSRAIAESGPFKMSGLLAWFAWVAVHIYFLIGFRNRFVVLVDWMWAYFSWRRGARLIVGVPADAAAPRNADGSVPSCGTGGADVGEPTLREVSGQG